MEEPVIIHSSQANALKPRAKFILGLVMGTTNPVRAAEGAIEAALVDLPASTPKAKLTALILVSLLPCWVCAANLPQDERVPGGVAVVALPEEAGIEPQVFEDERRIMVLSHEGKWFAVVGVPLDAAPGIRTLQVAIGDATPLSVSFTVMAKYYPEQQLTIRNAEMVTPTVADEVRIEREQRHLGEVFSAWRPVTSPDVNFIWPAKGPETSPFGVRRVLNGAPRSPHSGIDIGAPLGAPVRAPADGVVADVGHYYFCGKTLTLDMGQGLFSVYCHLSRIRVKLGQKVKQGQVVGNIGATGRTTGPNLHWTVRLNDTIVDPHAFLPAVSPAPTIRTSVAPDEAPLPGGGIIHGNVH
jgi:murein DD-endopeptidase MepM/ murein hydrolase activator NlpD